MSYTGDARDRGSSRILENPRETEVAQLLHEAEEQYEECMCLADLADLSHQGEFTQPRYAWDNPIGLVVSARANTELV